MTSSPDLNTLIRSIKDPGISNSSTGTPSTEGLPTGGTPIIPGFPETALQPVTSAREEIERASDTARKVRTAVRLISKMGSADLWENAPGERRPYKDGSPQEEKDRWSGIDAAFDSNDKIDEGSGMPEPPLLNQ